MVKISDCVSSIFLEHVHIESSCRECRSAGHYAVHRASLFTLLGIASAISVRAVATWYARYRTHYTVEHKFGLAFDFRQLNFITARTSQSDRVLLSSPSFHVHYERSTEPISFNLRAIGSLFVPLSSLIPVSVAALPHLVLRYTRPYFLNALRITFLQNGI